MCRCLGVSPSGYYEWSQRGPSKTHQANQELIRRLRVQHVKHKARYGSRRHRRELKRADINMKVGRNRVRRLMRENGMVAKQRRRFRITTNSAHESPVFPNHLNREFKPAKPNQAWVGDITYIPTSGGFIYLATVMDLFSRRVVGWSISNRITRALVIQAFRLAVGRRRCAPNLLFHSDRGSQYASVDYRKLLKAFGIQGSMSRPANCWDNAVAESFFATLEKELLVDLAGKDATIVGAGVASYIEGYYNRIRLHSAIGYRTPVEAEEQWEADMAGAAQDVDGKEMVGDQELS